MKIDELAYFAFYILVSMLLAQTKRLDKITELVVNGDMVYADRR